MFLLSPFLHGGTMRSEAGGGGLSPNGCTPISSTFHFCLAAPFSLPVSAPPSRGRAGGPRTYVLSGIVAITAGSPWLLVILSTVCK